MNVCLPRERLEQVLADPGQMGEADLRALELHTGDCPACRETLEQLICGGDLQEWRDLLGFGRPEVAPAGVAAETPAGPAGQDGPVGPPFPPATVAGYLGQLGDYLIQRRLGGGAMGSVFLAYDVRLHRQVALKVPRPDLGTSAPFRDRFEREARAAASVRHEHVVTTHHVADTPGFPLPYLVMEYIEGETLGDRLKRQAALPPREAAAIAGQVASGLDAAHVKGVVHRDVKPSNIMLERGSGRARVTDFGLARAADGTDQISGSGSVVGTPSYMSPEQIQPPHRVDARSDVFGLGVVLYEMLTGERPFRGTMPPMVMQQVVHEEPPPPRKLNDAVSRELETVTLKCLAKEPGRRYQTAKEAGDDLRRWLNGEPIRARRVGAAGKCWRWCRRNRTLAAVTGLAAAALVAVTTVSILFGLHKAATAEKEAATAEEARRAAGKARNASRFLVHLLDASEPIGFRGPTFGNGGGKGRHLSIRESLDRQAERITEELGDQPDVQTMLMDTIGNRYRSLGLYPEARALLGSSCEIRRRVLGEKHPEVATGLYYLGWLSHDQGDYEAAGRYYQEALGISQRLGGGGPLGDSIKFNLAWLLTDMEEYAAGESLFREVLDSRLEQMGKDHRDVAIARLGLTVALKEQERYPEAVGQGLLAWGYFRDQEVGKTMTKVLNLMVGAGVAKSLGRYERAAGSLRECVEIGRRSLGEKHPYVAVVLTELALTLEKAGRADGEAEKCYRECLDIAGRTKGYEHPRVGEQVRYLAALLARTGRYPKAEELFEGLLKRRRSQFADGHLLLADTLTDFGRFLADYGDADKAERTLREALGIYRKRDAHRFTKFYELCLNNLGTVLVRKGRYREAELLLRESLPLMEKRLGKNYRKQMAPVLQHRAWALMHQGRHSEGELALREALSIDPGITGKKPKDMVSLAGVCSRAAAVVAKDGRLARAERENLAERYAGHAIELLTKAHAAGYFLDPGKVEYIRKDTGLEPLRSREDFKKLLSNLEGKPSAGSR
jgi:serine/threonine-protein kinase